jgi:uncharacterized protein
VYLLLKIKVLQISGGLMSINDLYAILIGAGGGIAAALFGVGGAIVIVPGLVILMHFSQKMAQGTSLFMLLPPIGILAAYQYYKKGLVNVRVGLFLIIGFMIASYIVAKFVVNIPDNWLRKGFAVFLIAIAVRMLIK